MHRFVLALLPIGACTGLLLPRCRTGLLLSPLRQQHTSRLDRLGLTASAEEPSFDELFAQGTAYVQSGNLGLAVGCFQGAARLDPSHEPTQKLLAKLEGLGMTFEAEADEAKELEAELEEEEEEEELGLELSEPMPKTTSKAVTRAETVDERNERVDAALAELGRTGSTEAAATALGPITPTAPSAELRPGALVFVAGGATPLGAEALRAMGQFTPRRVDMALSPAALKAELTDADALVVISEAAGGSGGVAPDKLKLLMAAVPAGITRLLYVGVHGVERTDKLPFSLQNVFGQLDKQRAAEQEPTRHRLTTPSLTTSLLPPYYLLTASSLPPHCLRTTSVLPPYYYNLLPSRRCSCARSTRCPRTRCCA